MRNRLSSLVSSKYSISESMDSSDSMSPLTATFHVWTRRLAALIILLVFIMPVALLLTPWWIMMQPFRRACPIMMDGYYRIITWPLKLSKNIRSYSKEDRFIENLKY